MTVSISTASDTEDNEAFVGEGSIVREIWGNPDTILFVFAGAAAEFALNKAVDWLYFTGKLPADPLGRLFSTVGYARKIVFSSSVHANGVIDAMFTIHSEVEKKRGSSIPAWAYRDVLYMLIDYSIRAYELLFRPLTESECEEVYAVFHRVGTRMRVVDLPKNFKLWKTDRELHMREDLDYSKYTADLFRQYRLHLGWVRFRILRAAQGVIVPDLVRSKLRLRNSAMFRFTISIYRTLVKLNLDRYVKKMILPRAYASQIAGLKQHK